MDSTDLRQLITLDQTWKKVTCGILGLYGIYKIGKFSLWHFIRLIRGRGKEKEFKNGVVYLHMFPRRYTRQTLNLSPFAIKVESWLRLHKIPYEVVETLKMSQDTKQIPYIHFNNEVMSDSAFIIPYLAQMFNVDLDAEMTAEQQGVARAFQRMVDEATSWTYFICRYSYLASSFRRVFRIYNVEWLDKYVNRFLKKSIEKRANFQGIGRQTKENVATLGKDDLRAISKYLGNKDFLMGDTPTTVDCAMFGHLSQLIPVDLDFPHKTLLTTECVNIVQYFERLKQRLWPDWNTIVNDKPFFN